jgi:acyl-coenzyme A synthetase/AMP-(fatty) acid ligase
MSASEFRWDVPDQFNFTRDVVERLAEDPNRRALTAVDAEGIITRKTFAELALEATRWAHLIRGRGTEPGDRVVVVVGKVPDWLGIMLGAIKAGLIAIPCPDMLRARDLAFRVEHSGASVVIADRSAQAEIDGMRGLLDTPVDIVFRDDAELLLGRQPSTAPTEDTRWIDNAFILYTSGTTKDPKGVTHTHGYTFAKRMQAEHWLGARPGDVVWCTAATGWAKAIWNVLLGPWSRGAETVLHESPFDPVERFDLIDRLGVTILCQSPTEYRLMAKLDEVERYPLSRLRHAVSAGEPLNPEVIGRFRDAFGLTIHDGYGQTENSLLVANTVATDVRPGSMGLPTPGHDVHVIGDDGEPAAPGVEGDIALRGRPPTLFTHYWRDREETAAVFRGDWYVTGDRAVRDEDGFFWFTGRADDVITSAGYRIGPFEVESALLEHGAVAESAAIGKPDHDRGEIVKAFVVLRPGIEPSDDLVRELQEHAKAVTSPHKYPREVEFVHDLPKTRSGKIRRVELRELERRRLAGAHEASTFDGSSALPPASVDGTGTADPRRGERDTAAREQASDAVVIDPAAPPLSWHTGSAHSHHGRREGRAREDAARTVERATGAQTGETEDGGANRAPTAGPDAPRADVLSAMPAPLQPHGERDHIESDESQTFLARFDAYRMTPPMAWAQEPPARADEADADEDGVAR